MATRVLNANAPNQNYTDGQNFLTNGVAGVAPMAGDTVVLNSSPPNGPITATNLAINGETIQLSNNAQFYSAGTTSFGTAGAITTTLTDTNASGVGTDIQLGGGFVNNGTIINAASIFIGQQSSQTNTPVITNNGTFSYTSSTNPNQTSAYSINGYNSSNIAEFNNAGAIFVLSSPGYNQGVSNNNTVTYLNYAGVFNQASTGTVTITGSAPNTTGFSASGATESVAEFVGNTTGNGTYILNDGEVQFDGTSSGVVTFNDGSSILDIANVTNVAETLTITGFRAGDAIGLGTTAITSAAYDAGTGKIDLFNGATMVTSISLVATGGQNLATASYTIVPLSAVSPDAVGILPTQSSSRNQVYLETNLAAPCYCPGTLIRTDRGDVAVEQLAIGDRVVTLTGTAEPIKWIGRRAFAGRFVEGRRDILPVCIRAGALGTDLPRRDLWVSPLHAMYLDGALVPAAELVNGASVTQATTVERVEYIHVELERHQVIWAENAASESFVDDYSRAMFHNAHEFAALYPDAAAVPALYCAPRVEGGEALAAIKRPIDRRAGLAMPESGERLQGRVDALDGLMLSGWAQNPEKPEAAVCLEVLVDGVVAARTVANSFRADLLAAGLGSGCHSFRVRLPKVAKQARIEVRRVADGQALGALDMRKRVAA